MGAEPLGLTGAGFEHLGAEFGGGWAGGHLGELGERDGGDLDVQVDAVEQGAGDATQVLLDLGRRAGAGAAGIGPVSAGAGVHGGDEDEVGGEGRAAEGPADGDLAFLERLAQDLERLAIELGHLVEEEDALVGQADLARLGRAAATDQAGVADGVWKAKWQVGTAFVYGRQRTIRWKEIICLWRVLGWEVPVKAIVAYVEGYKKRFTLVTSAVELTGLQMVELFAARFRQEDGFRDLKQRLGWEECRAWTANPIQRTSQAQWVTMSLLRLLQFRLEASGKVGWWLRPPWNKKKDRPSVLNAERLMRRHREQIQRLLSKWARIEGNTEEAAA